MRAQMWWAAVACIVFAAAAGAQEPHLVSTANVSAPPTPASSCLFSDDASLKQCRVARNSNSGMYQSLSSFDQYSQNVLPRYQWALCDTDHPGQFCNLEPGGSQHCDWKHSLDNMRVHQTRCTLANFRKTLKREQCYALANDNQHNGFASAGTEATGTGFNSVLQDAQPDANGVLDPAYYNPQPSCGFKDTLVNTTKSAFPGVPYGLPTPIKYLFSGARTIDPGIGTWDAIEFPLAANAPWQGYGPFVTKLNDGGKPFSIWWSETMSCPGCPIDWIESYLQQWFSYDYYAVVAKTALSNPVVQAAMNAGELPSPAGLIEAQCYNNKASALIEGFNNPPGQPGQTATAANIDITTSVNGLTAGGTSTSTTVAQLLNDLRAVITTFTTWKRQTVDCRQRQQYWGAYCESLPDGLFAHSMGAIAARVYGIHTAASFGSVDNSPGGGSSYLNNCDPVPVLTQIGIDLLLNTMQLNVPADDPIVPCSNTRLDNCQCTSAMTSNPATAPPPCKGRKGQNYWVMGSSNMGPHTASCEGGNPDLCWEWWCAGRPGMPQTRINTGRTGAIAHTPPTGAYSKCTNDAVTLTAASTCLQCLIGFPAPGVDCPQLFPTPDGGVSGDLATLYNLYNCVQSFKGVSMSVADHVIDGNDDVKANGYQAANNAMANLGHRDSVSAVMWFVDNSKAPTTGSASTTNGTATGTTTSGSTSGSGGGGGTGGGGSGTTGTTTGSTTSTTSGSTTSTTSGSTTSTTSGSTTSTTSGSTTSTTSGSTTSTTSGTTTTGGTGTTTTGSTTSGTTTSGDTCGATCNLARLCPPSGNCSQFDTSTVHYYCSSCGCCLPD
jgi:hypothetical protein